VALLLLLPLLAGTGAPEGEPGYLELLPERLLAGKPVERIEQIEPLLARLRGELGIPAPGGSLLVHPVPDLQGGYTALAVLQLDPAPWPRFLMTYFHELGHRGYHRERPIEEARAELLRYRALFHLLDRKPDLAPLFLSDLRSYQRFRDPLPFPDRRKGPEGTTPVDRDYRDAAVVALALWQRAWRAGEAAPLEAARAFIDQTLSGDVRLAVERERARPGGQAAILRSWARTEILPRLDRSLAALPEGPERSLVAAARLFYLDPLDRGAARRAARALGELAASEEETELALQAVSLARSILVDDLGALEEAETWLEKLARERGGILRATLYRRLGELRESSTGDRVGAAEAYRASLRVATAGSLFADEVIGRLGKVEDTSEPRLFDALRAGSPRNDLTRDLVRVVSVLRILGRDVRAAQLVAQYSDRLRPPALRALLLKERASALAASANLADASEAWRTLRGRTDDQGWSALAAFREGHDGLEALRRDQVKERQRGKVADRSAAALALTAELLPPGVPADRAGFDLILLRLARGQAEGIETDITAFAKAHAASDLLPALELLALPPARGPAEARLEGESELQARLWAWLARHPRDRRGPGAFGRLAGALGGGAPAALLAGLCTLRFPGDEDCSALAGRVLAEGKPTAWPEELGALAGEAEDPIEPALDTVTAAGCRAPPVVAFRGAGLLLDEGFAAETAAICDCALAVVEQSEEGGVLADRLRRLRERACPSPSPSGASEANP
jgi:hypothetical protein